MAKQAIEGRRINAFGVDPNTLTIIGLDTEDGPEHALWDERIKLPISEPLVKNIMSQGVLEPVLVQKDGDRVVVIAGRQRVRCAREANKRLGSQGCETLEVPVMVKRGPEDQMLGVMVSENELRQDDVFTARARKLTSLLALGKSEADCAVLFGVSTQTISNWLSLCEVSAPVRAALDAGKLSATAALKIGKLPKGEQGAALSVLLSGDGKATAAKAERVARQARDPGAPKSTAPSKRLLQRLVKDVWFDADNLTPVDTAVLATLHWILGEDVDFAELPEGFEKAVARAKQALKKGGAK